MSAGDSPARRYRFRLPEPIGTDEREKTMAKRTRGLASLLLLSGLGCGGGGGGGTRHMTWKDDGTQETAIVAEAQRTMQGTSDFLNLLGTNASVGMTIVVSATGRSLGAETFDCNQTAADQGVNLTY